MYAKTPLALIILISISCKNNDSNPKMLTSAGFVITNNANQNPYADIAAIPIPAGYKRLNYEENSFGKWLSRVQLKKNKTVYLYDGTKKNNQSAQFAVLEIPVGNKNLQQCADAVMRLRASWLFDQKKYDSIVFYDNDGKAYRFLAPYTIKHFNEYLATVFGMYGTSSLSKQLKRTTLDEIQAGDVFIRGGFPGHAVIVMDVIQNGKGEKKYLLAQSYMPAQDIHVLLNPEDGSGSPWYDVSDDDAIITPEYSFYSFELKRW